MTRTSKLRKGELKLCGGKRTTEAQRDWFHPAVTDVRAVLQETRQIIIQYVAGTGKRSKRSKRFISKFDETLQLIRFNPV